MLSADPELDPEFDLDGTRHDLQALLRTALTAALPLTRLTEIMDAESDEDPASWRRLADIGVLGLSAPSEHGGAGEGILTLAVAAEEVGYAAVPGAYIGHVLAVLALGEGGDDDQRRHWLPLLAGGHRHATVALSGHDTPERTVRGLSGTVPVVPGIAGADLVVVSTAEGLSAVPVAAPGVSTRPVAGIDRTRRLGSLTLENAAHTPLAGGRVLARRVLDAARVLVAADAHGGARRCLDLGLAHARERVQFGKRIGDFQAVRHQLADLATLIEPGRGLFWLAARRLDARDERGGTSAAAAKAHLTEVFIAAARHCVRLHGALGYTWDGPVNPWVKRAPLDHSLYGTPRSLRAVVAADLGWG